MEILSAGDQTEIGEKGIKYLQKGKLPKAEYIDISSQQVSEVSLRFVTKHSDISQTATGNNFRGFVANIL